jgi:hypothetical protein
METLFLSCPIPSRTLLNYPWIFEIVWNEISAIVPKLGVYYTKSSHGPLVFAILSVGICPSDMSWGIDPAIFSTTLEGGPVRNGKYIQLLANFFTGACGPSFRDIKLLFSSLAARTDLGNGALCSQRTCPTYCRAVWLHVR